MKEFLKKYMTSEELTALETKYVADHPDAKTLPVYISKTRFDEVLGKKKTAEDEIVTHKEALRVAQEDVDKKIADAVKIETDKHAAEIVTMQNDFTFTEEIFKAKGKNVKAIKALIDPAKKPAEEIQRILKSDPYLFEDDIPGGTGKEGTAGGKEEDAQTASMRAVLGI